MNVFTNNAIQILEDRYLLKDKNGVLIETPDELLRRVATHVSSCEHHQKKHYKQRFYELLSSLKFLPNSPTLMNAGCENGQLSACFVLPIEDSLDSIFTTLKNAALIHQSGGGTGFNFSKLRPKDDIVSSTSGTTSGPVAFMKIYDAATEYVKQGGKRRGANMGILNINHPDIEEFISCKSSKKAIENFNISVGITDDFMKAVKHNKDWHLVNPRTKDVSKTLPAKQLWKSIVEEAWRTGDPGLIFLDTINTSNPTPKLGNIQSTNPCGEVPLLDFESCNLGSINLSKMILHNKGQLQIDWEELSKTVQLSIRFLDNIITLNHYLLPDIKSITTANRKIGLGVMGWAELLMLLDIPYASTKAIALGEDVMKFIKAESYKASKLLAEERSTFPNWNNSFYFPDNKLRNATCNSIAPTGTISVIANTSYSIEPLFALAFKRVGILGNKTQTEINTVFLQKMKTLNLWTNELKNKVFETGSIKNASSVPEHIKSIFQTSLDIHWSFHLLHQKAFQKHTDNAVSKTINLPEDVTVDDVSKIFFTAWQYELKGITIYRYGSRDHQVLQKCSLNNTKDC
ncbi:adenosylcobalamin-dependent ribonucleoside-diphosphate reductase [uncultured Psychroserpens sp.]|uniref:adenosylcobalamin-dependent ribonucleoside-diphosphate reductase n=1 Tax=uncultured Psychroserpens sp. TaxID=255436 RepID=UPI002625BD29|nr:adenosylcobalamin-dependent ribonucleoside-diphosphate reductase [uncultured Psychroserpens sp.]